MKTVGLCMIVKNESQVILRCLRNVRPLIDYALIVDTGSTDGTQEIVKEYLSGTGLPGAVIEEPWCDFAHNRSFALAKLRERADIDYALVTDADDLLVFADDFDASTFKAALDKDVYNVEIRLGPTRLWRPQILSNRLEFSYKGVVQEFLVAPRTVSAAGVAPGVYIEAGTDGVRSGNPDKYRDDAMTLEKALEKETDENIRARYTFYLAANWMCVGEKEKALQAFLQRAERGPPGQEVAISLYHAAQLKEALGYHDTDIIGTFLKAYEVDPRRAESLHGAMRYCRLTNKPHQGFLIGKHAIDIAKPIGDLAFASWIYDYGVLEEFAAAAYSSGHYQYCVRSVEKILADRKIPESERPRLRENARIAAEKLAGSAPKPKKAPGMAL
jgi:glycosyltransferase involved in cell wall biosynthesis